MARKIQVEILGDSRGLERAFRRSGSAASGFGSKIGRIARIGAASLFALGAAAGGLAIGFGIKSVKAASDLGEQVNKVSVIFQKSAKGILRWSETTASSFGISQEKALEFVGTFGNMFAPMGIAVQKSKKMSTSLVELAADMASFNNLRPEDVLIALQAGLAGQVRPLRRMGVFLSADRVKAEALASGIVTTTKSMSGIHKATLDVTDAVHAHTEAVKRYGPASMQAQRATVNLEIAQDRLGKATAGVAPKLNAQQKALGAYNIIMRDTKHAHGDFRRTLKISLPNAMRVLRAQTSNLTEAFGKGLIPVVMRAAQTLRNRLADPKVRAEVQRMGHVVGVTLYKAFISISRWFKVHWPAIKIGLKQGLHIMKQIAAVSGKVADAFGIVEKFKGPSGIDVFHAIERAPGKLSEKLQGLRVTPSGGGGKHGDVVVNLDGKEIARNSIKHAQRGAKTTSASRRGHHASSKWGLH